MILADEEILPWDSEAKLERIRALFDSYPQASFMLSFVTFETDGTATTGVLGMHRSPLELIFAADELLDFASRAFQALAPIDRGSADSRELLQRIEHARAALGVQEAGARDA